MKNKTTLLIVVLTIFFGLLLYINFNRKSSEKKKVKIEKVEERKRFVQDSIRQINEKNEALKKIELNKIANRKRIDGYTNKSNSKFDIAILITNDNNQIVNDLTLKIAKLYRNHGHSVTSSLFTSSFIQSKYLPELQNSNSEVIGMLKLNNSVKHIIIGKISYSFRNGTLVEGTSICTAKISVNIISVIQKSIKNGFAFSVNGNGVTETQAQEEAQEKLINKYNNEYSSL